MLSINDKEINLKNASHFVEVNDRIIVGFVLFGSMLNIFALCVLELEHFGSRSFTILAFLVFIGHNFKSRKFKLMNQPLFSSNVEIFRIKTKLNACNSVHFVIDVTFKEQLKSRMIDLEFILA